MAEGTRKEFLAAASIAGVSILTPATVLAQTSSTPSPAPAAKPTPAPSEAARAFAERMRKFDPQLTHAQIDEIAQGVDQSFGMGKHLRKVDALTNGDAPSPQFEVRG